VTAGGSRRPRDDDPLDDDLIERVFRPGGNAPFRGDLISGAADRT